MISILEPHEIIHDHFTRFRKHIEAMDSNTKLLLDELKSVKISLESPLDGQIREVEASLGKRIGAMEHSIADRFNRLEEAAKVLNEWKPKVDASVAELRAELGEVRKSDAVVEQMREEMTTLRKIVSRVVLNSDPLASAGVLKPANTRLTSTLVCSFCDE